MTRLLTTLLLAGTLAIPALAIPPGCNGSDRDRTVANTRYPQVLIDDYQEVFVGGRKLREEVCVATADLDANGQVDHHVVAYSNSVDTVLAVLRTDGTVVEMDSATLYPGGKPQLHLEDLTGDRISEIFLSTAPGPSMPVWLLRWNGRSLEQIGPKSDSGETLLYEDLDILDLTADGLSDVMVHASAVDDRDAKGMYAYTIAGGTLAPLGHIPWTGWLSRETAEPTFTTTTVNAAPGTYTLRLVNSLADDRAAAAVITLNGTTVVKPGDFRTQQAIINVPVTLQTTNELTVDVRGEPDTGFLLLFLSIK